MDKDRDIRIDILRMIGLLCIILCHARPPIFIEQLREFDVPLMVLISGCSFRYSFVQKDIFYFAYLRRRMQKLIGPVWVFLIIYFSLSWSLYYVSGREYLYTSDQVIGSFFLIGGLGYLWIIRVFLLVAIVAPLIARLYKLFGIKLFACLLILFYAVYEVFFAYTVFSDHSLHIQKLLQIVVYPIWAYSLVFGLGLCLLDMPRNFVLFFSVFLFLIFVYIWLDKYSALGIDFSVTNIWYSIGELQTYLYKHPPQLYYLTYALSISGILWFSLQKVQKIQSSLLYRFITFMSSYSLWIYLWHILVRFMWFRFVRTFGLENIGWGLMFFTMVAMSLMIVYTQEKLMHFLLIRSTSPMKKKIFIDLFGRS